jgi:hypothetical protein
MAGAIEVVLEIMWTNLATLSVIVTENGTHSSQGHATVHNDLCACDEAGFIRAEKQHSIGNFFWLPEALHRLSGGEITTRGHRIWQRSKPLLQEGLSTVPGQNAVDSDAILYISRWPCSLSER